MKQGDLVQYKLFVDSDEKLGNIGVILELQTDLMVPSRYSGALYEKIDLISIRWLNENAREYVPYYKRDYDGQRWYLRTNFYLVF
jgi:hypothetical protein